MNIDIKNITDLSNAYDHSYYAIAGCGGDLAEWTAGYERLLAEQGIGKPQEWITFTGAAVNQAAEAGGRYIIDPKDKFDNDLTFLAFPLNGLHIGKLAMFKLNMRDRWFDDIIDNMRRQCDD